ncbi:MAG: hypothetical protein ACRCRP_01810 [Metamycoplasmataceae bacterium]
MKKNEEEITIFLENGEEKKAKVVFAFNEAGDDYILYSLEGAIYPAIINDKNEILPIPEEEIDIIETIYNEYLDSLDETDEEEFDDEIDDEDFDEE